MFVEASVLALPRIYINGGQRGYLVGIDPVCLTGLLGAQPVDCAARIAGHADAQHRAGHARAYLVGCCRSR